MSKLLPFIVISTLLFIIVYDIAREPEGQADKALNADIEEMQREMDELKDEITRLEAKQEELKELDESEDTFRIDLEDLNQILQSDNIAELKKLYDKSECIFEMQKLEKRINELLLEERRISEETQHFTPQVQYPKNNQQPTLQYQEPKLTTCFSCRGSGLDACNMCRGTGNSHVTCYLCKGTGVISSGAIACVSCSGRGFGECFSCSGSGLRTCDFCRGRGVR